LSCVVRSAVSLKILKGGRQKDRDGDVDLMSNRETNSRFVPTGDGIVAPCVGVIRLHCYPGEPPFRAASRDSGSTGRSAFLGQGMSSI
jgi:hypothetical protein